MPDSVSAMAGWVVPPPNLDLTGNEVHLWLIAADDAAICAAGSDDRLSSMERDRASRFKFETHRRRYITAHGALREILAGYLGVDPKQLDFCQGAYGKPELISAAHREPLSFNLSHSHEAALVAVTLGRQIGVDIEYIKREFQWQEVAERFFAPGEVARLRALPRDKQQRAFFTCWTRKEAYIKAKGGGLSIPLQDFEVSLSPEEPASLISCSSDPEEVLRWSLAEVDVGPEYAAAVAVQGEGWHLQCWRWQESVGTGGGT